MNVLLIHDNSMYSALIVEFLRFRGYVVHEAGDAEIAGANLRRMQVDLVICILPSEHSDRFDLLSELHDLHPGLPLIALATYPMSVQRQAQLQEYTPYSLTKPFEVTSLLNMIVDATGIRKTRVRLSTTKATNP